MTNATPLPYSVRRSLMRFRPELRDSLERAIVSKMSTHPERPLTAEEISECVMTVVLGDGTQCDTGMEKICREAYDAGKFTKLRDRINELRAVVTRPATVSDCGMGATAGC